MAELEQIESNINTLFQELDKDVYKSPYELTQKNKWISDCEMKFKLIKAQISNYNYYFQEIPKEMNSKYVSIMKNFNIRLNKIREDFQTKKNKSVLQNNNLFSGREETKPITELNQMQLIQRGDDVQNKMKEMINDMEITVDQGLSLADTINAQLNRQIQLLDRMAVQVDDTGTVLRRAQLQITYFKKVMECDKCMLALLFLIAIAIIVLIIVVTKSKK